MEKCFSPAVPLFSCCETCAQDLVTGSYLSSSKTTGCIISFTICIRRVCKISKIDSANSQLLRKPLQISGCSITTLHNQNRLKGCEMVSWPSGLKNYSRYFHVNNKGHIDRISNISNTPHNSWTTSAVLPV